jgi:hypothetical protein
MINDPKFLDSFLKIDPPDADPALHQDVLARTLSVVRRRRLVRRAGLVAGFAACFAAGALTMRLLTPTVEPEVRIVERFIDREAVPAPTPQLDPSVIAQAKSALDIEWQAVENPERRAELFRRAGDRYLNDENDLESAVRCYKIALEGASVEELQVTPQDTWLLISLKNARQEENRHGKSDS